MSWNALDLAMKTDCENTNYFNQIPDEMLLEIFSYLHQTDLIKVAKLSKRFERVAKHEPFWKTSSLTIPYLKPDEFDDLMKFPIKELKLAVREMEPILFDELGMSIGERKINYTKNLDILLLSDSDPKSCQYVLGRCQPIHLVLREINLRPGLLDVIPNNTRLATLLMRDVVFDGPFGFEFTTRLMLCKNLKWLELENCDINKDQMQRLLECTPISLERLIWGRLYLKKFNDYNFGPSHIQTIASRLTNLRLLGVSVLYLRRRLDIASLARLPFLDTLRLCHSESQVVFIELPNILSNLHNVRTIQFILNNKLPEKWKEDFKRKSQELKRQILNNNGIDFEVQYITGSNVSKKNKSHENFNIY